MTSPSSLRPLLPLPSTFSPSSDSSNSPKIFSPSNLAPFHLCAVSYASSSARSRRRFGGPHRSFNFSSSQTWLCAWNKRDQNIDGLRNEDIDSSRNEDIDSSRNDDVCQPEMYGFEGDDSSQIPTQAQSIVQGSGEVLVAEYRPVPDVDYLQELLAIQQQGPRSIGFFGTRNMGFMHQELIEILSYAMVITKNHIFTSGASGTNAAVIRGALRAERQELLTVILPQSLKKQPPESQELLSKVSNVIEKPHNDHLPLVEASRLCNMDIISQVQQVICFAFHDSKLLMETCQEAKNLRKIVTLFYLD